jgi:hypothetical protein
LADGSFGVCCSVSSLKAELETELKDKCFLLVLDDLWVDGDNMKERRILLDVLAKGQNRSRILVTAQKKKMQLQVYVLRRKCKSQYLI